MATAGQTLENPVTGERITFIKTAADTNGESVEILLGLPAKQGVPGTHVHPEQFETFHVLAGTMRFRYGFKWIVAGPGDTVVVPPGKVHDFANAGDTDAIVRVVIEPALDMETLFETAVGLAQEGHVDRRGMPRPLHLALFVERFRREAAAPFLPAAVVRLLLAPLRAIALRRGLGDRYGLARPRRSRGGEPLAA